MTKVRISGVVKGNKEEVWRNGQGKSYFVLVDSSGAKGQTETYKIKIFGDEMPRFDIGKKINIDCYLNSREYNYDYYLGLTACKNQSEVLPIKLKSEISDDIPF